MAHAGTIENVWSALRETFSTLDSRNLETLIEVSDADENLVRYYVVDHSAETVLYVSNVHSEPLGLWQVCSETHMSKIHI